jgi:hypothetical protein
MSAAEKYGSVQSMPAGSQAQAREAGQALADKGVTHSAGTQQTPAAKYGAPAPNHVQRSLHQGRSL